MHTQENTHRRAVFSTLSSSHEGNRHAQLTLNHPIVCVLFRVLHIKACYKRTQQVRITQELGSRRHVVYLGEQAAPRPQTFFKHIDVETRRTVHKVFKDKQDTFRAQWKVLSVTDEGGRERGGGMMEENEEE